MCMSFSQCTTKSTNVITMDCYLATENGQTRQELIDEFGSPYSITLDDSGTETFTYIERLYMNNVTVEIRYYYFYIKDDKVIGKMVKIVDRPSTMDAEQL